MRRTKIGLCIVSALIAAIGTGGCGAITAGTVVQKGGMWLAKEAVKKGYKKYKEDHEERDSHDEGGDRHGYANDHSERSHSHHRGNEHRE